MTTEVAVVPWLETLLGTAPADLVPDPAIDYDSGEPVTAVIVSDEETARARVEQIRRGLPTYLEVRELLAIAYAEEDWRALHYQSWGAYLLHEYSGVALPREHRKEAIKASIVERPELSDRQHAQRAGATHPTATAARKHLEETGRVEKLSTRTDAGGRQQPAKKSTPASKPAPAPAPKLKSPLSDEERRAADERYQAAEEERIRRDEIEAAKYIASRIVTQFLSDVSAIRGGYELGLTDLVTDDMLEKIDLGMKILRSCREG
jgi:hypothetical protein